MFGSARLSTVRSSPTTSTLAAIAISAHQRRLECCASPGAPWAGTVVEVGWDTMRVTIFWMSQGNESYYQNDATPMTARSNQNHHLERTVAPPHRPHSPPTRRNAHPVPPAPRRHIPRAPARRTPTRPQRAECAFGLAEPAQKRIGVRSRWSECDRWLPAAAGTPPVAPEVPEPEEPGPLVGPVGSVGPVGVAGGGVGLVDGRRAGPAARSRSATRARCRRPSPGRPCRRRWCPRRCRGSPPPSTPGVIPRRAAAGAGRSGSRWPARAARSGPPRAGRRPRCRRSAAACRRRRPGSRSTGRRCRPRRGRRGRARPRCRSR